MHREPSIHIYESKLRKILENLPDFLKKPDETAEYIVTQARKVSCDNRIITISNEKIKRDTKKLLLSNKGDANLLSTILYSIRKMKKHRGIQRIKEGTKDWKQIKELANIVLDFCNDFELRKREGFILYINTGLNRMSSPRNHLSKLIKMYEVISLTYEAQLIIDEDPCKDETLSIHHEYVGMISTKTGIVDTYDQDPINFVNFIRVREITDKYNVPIDIYLKAQFDGLEWTEGFPTPIQLSSDKAIDRLNKYMFKNKIKIKMSKEESSSKDLSNMLKKIKDGNYSN